MIIVTGGAGFIGSRLVQGLNAQGYTNILVVDDLSDGTKFKNLVNVDIQDYIDKDDFLAAIKQRQLFDLRIEAVFHQGACSDTTEWDGRYMMANNYEYSKVVLAYCQEHAIPFIYASSAAVYGDGKVFKEALQHEGPLNVYGYSKWLFDQHVRRILPQANGQIAGFRYFNVYGPNEAHKGNMSSVAHHFNQQLQKGDECRLFVGSDGYGDGEQRRDFVYVDDVVDVNLWFLANPSKSGIFNVGTGRSQTFNDVADSVIAWHQRGHKTYIPFPEHLVGRYQSFTEADISLLREAGYDKPFKSVEEGVACYMDAVAV